MYKDIKKFLFIALVALSSIYFPHVSYANVEITATSVTEYETSSTPYATIHIGIANSGEKIEGTLNVEIYENSKSIYNLMYPMYIYANSIQYKDVKINLNGNSNDILISIKDDTGKVISSRNFPLNNVNRFSKLSVGVISAGPVVDAFSECISNSLSDECDIAMLDEEKYYENDGLFSNIDVLILSDIDAQNFSSFFSRAIFNYVNNGGTAYILYKDLGLSSVIEEFTPYFMEHNFNENHTQQNIMIGKGMVVARDSSFFDTWIEGTSANAFTKNFIDLTLSLDKISQIQERKMLLTSEADITTSKLLERDNTIGMPNIYLHFILISSFIVLIGAIPFFLSRRFLLFKIFNKYALIVSAVFIVFIVALNVTYSSFRVIKNQTNIVAVNSNGTKEISFLTLRFPYASTYEFDVAGNVEIVPILGDNEAVNRNMIDTNFKDTTIVSDIDASTIRIINKEVYSKNNFYFIREHDNIYQVSFNSFYYDDHFIGSIENAMRNDIKNVYVVSGDKYINIGTVAAGSTIDTSSFAPLTLPINDNRYISDIAFKDNPDFLKLYLDLNSEKSSEGIYLFFTIYDAISTNLIGNDISQSTGNTVFIFKSNADDNFNRRDVNLLDCETTVLKGAYDQSSNTILGNEEVIIEYSLDSNVDYSKIYMNQIEERDLRDNMNLVPFKGNIYLYNYTTDSYDLILAHVIHSPKNYIDNDSKMRVRYFPSDSDSSYKSMYLTYFRLLGNVIRWW